MTDEAGGTYRAAVTTPRTLRRQGLSLTAVLIGTMMGPMPSADATTHSASRHIDYHQWSSTDQLRSGTLDGVAITDGRLHLPDGGPRAGTTRSVGGRSYEHGSWVSPWRSVGFGLTELVPSWSARTPRDSFIEVRVRGRATDGRESSWDLMGRWASGDDHLERTSRSGQDDDLASVEVDTWVARESAGLAAYQLKVTLLRRAGQTGSPRLDTIGAMASRLPAGSPATSRPGDVRGVVLDVPRYSQMIHEGHYPQWGGGGEAWCSPASTAMVLGYYDALPGARSRSWVPEGHPDPWVDAAARSTYDHDYGGTGNWPFNTAWAAGHVGSAFVTRLRGARQAELFIAAGIPLVASVSFGPGELSGAPISSTQGHLLVIVGFDRDGDVVVNDPAAPGSDGVRRTYDRAQFERAWLTRSGGLVYVVHDRAHPLPGGSHSNW